MAKKTEKKDPSPPAKAGAIIQREHPVLRETASPVPIEEIGSRKINTIIRRMQKALEAEEDGVAIAAPQIGESLRIFVVSKRIFELEDKDQGLSTGKEEDMIFINPEIVSLSKKKQIVEEGCLSVRWLYGKVERAEKAKVRAYNEQGRAFTYGGSGLLAQVFQHEMDHLNGVLFTDKAKALKEMPPQKQN